ncbi:MAG TPA: amidohydrolase family protein [Candidatus Limnocylindria bacterium]|nr:amidohydrolase family protein [Candidatus Limnocylindria bacterium]
MPDRYDLVIRHGTLVDGTGAAGRPGTLAVAGGRLALLPADAAVEGGRVVDASGMVVAPGFIDLHSHGGLAILADPRHEPKVSQGVTSEIVGVDGNGYAPFRHQSDLLDFVDLNAGLDGRPAIAYDWDDVASYLGRYDAGQAVNVGIVVGNSALRIGTVGWDDVPADERAVREMRAMLREALEEGAFGVSSGLDYPPGSYATTDELAALTNEAARHGGFYHTHVRYPLGDRFLDPFREAVEIGRRGEGPSHITHFYHRRTYPGPPEQLLSLVDDARAEGLDVTFDTYPYEWASTRLLIQLPQWIQAGGPTALKERLADGGARDRVRGELAARGAAYASAAGWADVRLGAFTRPEHRRWESASVADVMRDRGVDAVDAICDLLLAENLGVAQVTSGPWTDGLRRFLAHPGAMVGTDSTFLGDKPSPRTYGSYPRILGQFVRDEALLSLEEAVHRMTGAPAARLGLRGRGLLRDGHAADVVVFDPVSVRALATYDDPRQLPEGIGWVIVNGVPVIADGSHTGATPGRALRHGRD